MGFIWEYLNGAGLQDNGVCPDAGFAHNQSANSVELVRCKKTNGVVIVEWKVMLQYLGIFFEKE